MVIEELKEGTVSRLEEKIATLLPLSSINGIQPISKEYLDFMLGKTTPEKKTGFSQ